MIEIRIGLDRTGLLRSCLIKGHAGAGKTGGDIVCAAVSALVQAALRTFSGRKGINFQGAAPERGFVLIKTDYDAEGRDFLSASGTFFMEGLKAVSEKYPAHCKMNILEERI